MASLLIRNLDDALRDRLKARARRNHRSLEEEARETLRLAVAREASEPKSETLIDVANRILGADRGIELDLPPRSAEPERPAIDFNAPEYDR